MGLQRFLPLLAVLWHIQSCLAFNPSWFLVSGFPRADKLAFTIIDKLAGSEFSSWGRPHEAMTEKGVKYIYAPYFGISKITSSMDSARQEIMEGTKVVDKSGDREALISEAHCDDEELEACSQRLIDIRKEIPGLLAKGQVGVAREKLGRALHTLQDFYSHTNWVELNLYKISSQLGRSTKLDLPLAPATSQTCRDCEYTGGNIVRDAYILATDTCRKAYFGSDDKAAFSDLSKATIYGCMFATGAGVVNVASFTCANNLLNPFISPAQTMLTSGYFGTKKELRSNTRTVQKCNHGGPYDRDAYGREGISKDTQSTELSPKPKLHRDAVKYAEEATSQYLDDVKDEICKGTPTKDCGSLRLLYGVGPVLSFVIDTTGSMSSIIAAVRKDAIKIVNDRRGTSDEPSLYVMSQINDPTIPESSIYTDTDSFISAISALDIVNSNNPDCPEFGLTGISKAVDATPEGGLIFVWTDAATKNPSTGPSVAKAANKKNQEIIVFQFQAGCIDTTTVDRRAGYDTVTTNTGGALLPDLSRSDSGNTAKLATGFARNDVHKIITRFFKKRLVINKRDEAYAVEFPVDSSVDLLEISITGTVSDVVITRPDGRKVGVSDSDLTEIKVATGLLDTIDKPAVGKWIVSVSSSDDCTISVRGRSSISFSRFDFVTMQGGNGHDGWFATDEVPAAGTFIDTQAIIEGDFADASFEFRSPEGNLLSTVEMESGSGEDDFTPPKNYFWGAVTIPSEPFNIYITGKDSSGSMYQRVLPGILDIAFSQNTTNTTVVSNTTITPAPYINATGASILPNATSTTRIPSSTTISKVGEEWLPWTSGTESTQYQTLMYHSSWQAGGLWSTSLVTTIIDVPCWNDCATPLPVISPSCTTKWAGPAVAPADPSPSTAWGSWNSEASAQTLSLPDDETSTSQTTGYFPTDVEQTSLPSQSSGAHTEPHSSTHHGSWSSTPSSTEAHSDSDFTVDSTDSPDYEIVATTTQSSLIGVYTGGSYSYRPPFVMALAVVFMGLLFRTI